MSTTFFHSFLNPVLRDVEINESGIIYDLDGDVNHHIRPYID
jgi:hypothetical protein